MFLLKLVVLLELGKYPLLRPEADPESAAALELAKEIAGGDFALAPGLYPLPPLYLYFLALLLRLGGGLVSIQLVQVALGTAAVGLVYRTARLWGGERAAWLSAALAASTGALTFYELLLIPAALDPFLAALALYLVAAALRAPARTHSLRGAAAGIALGLFAINQPRGFILAGGLAAVLIATRRARLALLLAGGVLVAAGPTLIRNYLVAADTTPISSHGGLSFHIGNNASAGGTHAPAGGITPSLVTERQDARRAAEQAIGRALDDSEVSAHYYGLAWKWITSDPVSALRLFGRKVAVAASAAHPSLSYSYAYYARDEHTLLRYLAVGPWLLVPVGFAAIWFARPEGEQRQAFVVWASFAPLYMLALAAYYVAARDRLPLYVALSTTAGIALAALSAQFRPHQTAIAWRRRRMLVAAITVLMLAALANWPYAIDDGRTEERTRMALWLVGQGRFDEAQARIGQIERGHPRPGVLHFRFGRALMVRGQTDAAIRHLERAAASNPPPETDLILGQALLAADRPADAVPRLRRAHESGPDAALAGFDLARALAASGDRNGAVRVLQRVRPERADDGESWRALGELALELRVPRLAEGFLRQATRVDPRSASGFERLGLAIALTGRLPEAIAAFEQAVRLAPADASVRLNIAVALAEAGRTSEARRQAEEALRLDPGYDKAREFLRALK